MVAVIENWSDLVGRIQHISNQNPKRNFTTIALEVEQVDDVEGYPNLLADVDHTTVHLDVRNELLSQLGLKVEPTKGPREFIVVDRAERPSPN